MSVSSQWLLECIYTFYDTIKVKLARFLQLKISAQTAQRQILIIPPWVERAESSWLCLFSFCSMRVKKKTIEPVNAYHFKCGLFPKKIPGSLRTGRLK
jgi:hypothetical protein